VAVEPTVVVAPPAAKPDPHAPVRRDVRIRRAALDQALSDFDRLGREIQVEQVAGGGVLVTGIASGTLLHGAGLRKGDIIRAVAGQPLTTLEAAARVYATVSSASRFDVEIDRGPDRITFAFTVE
jgi:S1-C subfamily serine protease